MTLASTPHLADLLVDVAQRIILPRFRSLESNEIMEKKPGDLVTVADREAEDALTEVLQQLTPEAIVVGEESAFSDPTIVDALPTAPHAWVVDPVDGTRNFASGNADFGVMLAEVREGVTQRGWIWQPVHGRMVTVERGQGVRVNGQELVSTVPRRQPWHAAAPRRVRATADPAFAFTHTLGSCAIDYPRLATGAVDALVYTSQHPWDHLAGTLMMAELGGTATIVGSGEPWRVGERGRLLVVGADPAVTTALDRAARNVVEPR